MVDAKLHLLTLPIEIRHLILCYVLADKPVTFCPCLRPYGALQSTTNASPSVCICPFDRSLFQHDIDRVLNTIQCNIFHICRQLRTEVLSNPISKDVVSPCIVVCSSFCLMVLLDSPSCTSQHVMRMSSFKQVEPIHMINPSLRSIVNAGRYPIMVSLRLWFKNVSNERGNGRDLFGVYGDVFRVQGPALKMEQRRKARVNDARSGPAAIEKASSTWWAKMHRGVEEQLRPLRHGGVQHLDGSR